MQTQTNTPVRASAPTPSASTPAVPTTNKPTFETLLKTAADLGVKSGQSKDAQAQFILTVIEAAYLGTLTLDPDKHGTGIDDAEKMSEAYHSARNKSAIFDAKAGPIRKLCSNTRKCIKVGSSPKWGRGQPLQTVQEFAQQWRKLRTIPAEAKRLDDFANAMMRFLTAQLKSDTLLPDDERNAFCYKVQKEAKTEVEKLEQARKILRKSGDRSKEVVAAIDSIGLRLVNIAKGVK